MTRAVALLLAATLVVGACSRGGSMAFPGYVEGEYVYVASPLGGQLVELAVDRGDQAAAGEQLFRLDDSLERSALGEARQRLEQARNKLEDMRKGQRPTELAVIRARHAQAASALRLAQTEYGRRVKLFERKTISQEELDRARNDFEFAKEQANGILAELETARMGQREDEVRAVEADVSAQEARLDQARWNLDQKAQAAPMDSLVFDVLYRRGEWVPAGRAVVSLLPPGNVRVRFYVPETALGVLQVGQPVHILVDGRAEPVPGRIVFVSPEAEYAPPVIYSSQSRAKLVFRVEAKPEAAQALLLHPGQPVEVDVAGSGG